MPFDESELRAADLAWREAAKAWFTVAGRAVTIIVPSYRDHGFLQALFDGLISHTPAGSYRLIICDDCSEDAGHEQFLRRAEREHDFVSIVRGEANVGFAANVNRGLAIAELDCDVVLMNSDVVPLDGWLEALQYSLHNKPADLIGPKMLYPEGRIQYCGGATGRPERFRHIYQQRQEYFPPAVVRKPVLYATGAVLYIPAETRRRLGHLDPQFSWGHDDVDYALRCWTDGGTVEVEPRAVVIHHGSGVIGKRSADPRIEESRTRFWTKNAAFFERTISGDNGKSRVLLVTHELGPDRRAAGVRERLDLLTEAGFDCEIWNVGGTVRFIDRDIPSRGFASEHDLAAQLAATDAIKVCTDWRLSDAVWRGSILRGIPVYWARQPVRGADAAEEASIQASYRHEFTIIADAAEFAQTIAAAGFNRPVLARDDAHFVSILRRVAERPVFGYGRIVDP